MRIPAVSLGLGLASAVAILLHNAVRSGSDTSSQAHAVAEDNRVLTTNERSSRGAAFDPVESAGEIIPPQEALADSGADTQGAVTSGLNPIRLGARFDRAFDREPIDAQWASGAEGRIYHAMQLSGVDFVSLRAECRTTICRLEVTPSKREELQRQRFQSRLDTEQALEQAVTPVLDDDPRLSSVFTLNWFENPSNTSLIVYLSSGPPNSCLKGTSASPCEH